MKTFIFLCLTTVFGFTSNDVLSQNANIKINADKNLTVDEVFDLIMQQTNYKFIYQEGIFKDYPNIHVKKGTIKANDLLRKSFGSGDYEILLGAGDIVLVREKIKPSNVQSTDRQGFRVTGTVKDINGQPLPGANVLEKGTTNGTTTDFDGNFAIDISSANSVLTISYIGFVTKDVNVENEETVNIILEEDAAKLDEVVVTALGIKRSKKALAYSVTEVDADEFTRARETNVANSLVGKVAGVNVSRSSTGAGGSSRVVIRGSTSIGGNNQPLYVVDGVPINNDNLGAAGKFSGSDAGDGISSINPDDIESMSVLKGASAAALYGFRASNGVILITTKSGKGKEKLGVEFNSNFTLDQPLSFTNWQTTYGMGRGGVKPSNISEAMQFGYLSWGAKLDGSPVIQFDGVERPYSYQGNAMNAFYKNGYTLTNTVSMTFGGENANLRLSISDLENESVMPNSGLDRNVYTANGEIKYGKLTSSVSTSYTEQTINNAPIVSGLINSNAIVRYFPTSLNVNTLRGDPNKLGADPATGYELLGIGQSWWVNPYWYTYQNSRTDTKNRVFGSVKLKFDITDWLYIQGRLGLDYFTAKNEKLRPTGTGGNTGTGNSLSILNRVFEEVNKDVIIGFNKKFGESGFAINGTLGGSELLKKTEGTELIGQEFDIPFFHAYSNTKNQTSSVLFQQTKVKSLYYQGELSYNSFYFTATGRKDWFSTLDGKGIFYPSFGVSSVLSELFEIPKVSFLKIRGSIGQVGGGAGAPYLTTFTYALDQPHNGNSVAYISNSGVPNSNLVPSLSTEYEVGMDLRMFKNRLGIDFAYYNQRTENDILEVSTSAGSGYSSAILNIGKLSNKGIELLITGKPIVNEDFRWETTFNLSHNKSEVVSLVDPNDPNEIFVGDPNLSQSRTNTAWIAQVEGKPYGQIVGYPYARDNNGEIIIGDNGIRQGSRELSVFGSGVAPTTGGISNSFSYKNLNLSFLVDFKYGGYIFSGTDANAYWNGNHKATLEGRETGLGVIAPENIHNYYQTLYYTVAEEFVSKSDFIKFRQISLTYNFPEGLIGNTPLSALSISAVGRNLFFLYKATENIDPESSYSSGNYQGLEFSSLPSTRSIGLNLRAKF